MKKILALCLTVMLVLAMVPVIGASAADTAVFSVSEVTGYAGDEVTVIVSVDANPGLAMGQVRVGYDATALEVVGFNPLIFNDLKSSGSKVEDKLNPFIITFGNAEVDTTATGSVAELTFKIKDDAKADTYVLTVESLQENVFDTVFNDVPFTTQNGSITVACKHTNTSVVDIKEATCKAEGYTGDEKCLDCSEIIKSGSVIEKLKHVEVVEGAIPADCENAGSTGTTKCKVCGDVLIEATVIDAIGHTETVVGAKEATCEAEGYTGDTVCSVCDKEIAKGKVIEQKAHNWVAKEKKDATCVEAGMEAHYACDAGCGQVATDAEGKEIVKAEDLAIDKVAHKISKVNGVAATEEKEGVKEHYECSVCKALFSDAEGKTEIKKEDVVIAKLGKVEEPKTEEPKVEDNKADDSTKAPATNDVANIFVLVTMLMAIAAAAVVVLKKKA